ncbi:DNA translocase FtsK [Bacillus sp. FJAT-45037]|uniref:DNA translocase FtsK n=1 Tax=Bacillus sp. FJAT-45037 TaxID=2011007 RepID=UPI000C232122|nr:DNA translocase FtsK [Bacillus sp. FJAT-45037]
MSTLKQWMKRIQGAFFGESETENQEKHLEKEQEENKSPKKSSQGNRKRNIGYIEADGRNSEPRMVYQYPKPGKFKFPMIDDESKERTEQTEQSRPSFRQEEEGELESRDHSSERRKRPIDRQSEERSKRVVETPVEPPVDKKLKEKAVKVVRERKEFKPTFIPSPVYGFKERKYIMSEDESLPSSLPGHEKIVESKRESVTMEKQLETYLRQENIRNTQISATTEIEKLPKAVTEISEEKQPIDITPELENSQEKIELINEQNAKEATYQVTEFTIERDTDVVVESDEREVVQVIKEDIEKPIPFEDGLVLEEQVKEQEKKIEESPFDPEVIVAEPSISDDTRTEEILTEPTLTEVKTVVGENDRAMEAVTGKEQPKAIITKSSSPNRVVENTPKQPSTKEKKEEIPFNVMMLPQDRKQKKVQPQQVSVHSEYQHPSIQLLKYPEHQEDQDGEWLKEQAEILEETLLSFNVDAKVVNVTKGPSVTRYEIHPARGVKVNKVTSLTDDIKLALAAKDIRIEAPIPGKNTIGIEVPNRVSKPVFLREILRRDVFTKPDSPLTVALGLDISGQPIVTDLRKMPHGLVAGATGSGKSVCINSVLISLLYKANPDEVKLLLIDPKMVELAPYNKLPHLVTPVITDAKQATAALKWVVAEMERRYELFSQQGVRDVARYNELYSESKEKPALPYLLVVIDELADLMMVSPQDVEDSICRIAQKARACGIHLLLATQRPSVDVITGLIKANIPTRIAFSVSSQTDSRTILDMSGAERLLGRGDMLFHENGAPKPVRVQGTFVSDEEIEDVLAFVKKQREPEYLFAPEQLQKMQSHADQDDDLLEEACYYVIQQGGASASSIQRRFRVGYNRAARMIDMMEDMGVISEAMGSKPRHVLVDEIELEQLLYPAK